MHETVLASSLLRTALNAAASYEEAGQRLIITSLKLNVGVLASLEPQTLKGCFELLAEGTAAENAHLEICKIPMNGFCKDCGCKVQTLSCNFACPLCKGVQVEWQGGNEMELGAINVEQSPC